VKFGNAKIGLLKKMSVEALACVAVLAIAVPALPEPQEQQQSDSQTQKQGPTPTIKAEVNLVNLFATVRDKNKRIVTDLKQTDFQIFEDNHQEDIAFFSKEMNLPITLGLLLDTSGSEQYMLGAIQDAGAQFLHRVLKKGDEAMVISFDTDVDLLADFTDDRSILDRAINKARINTPGGGYIAGNPGPVGGQDMVGTALYDAIYLACGDKLNGEAGRKAIVVVTDAEDEGSKIKLEEAIEAAQKTDTVIHVLLVADRHFGGGRPDVGHRLAEETGGRMIVVNSEKRLQEAFDQISEELRSQYTLGYYPSNTTKDGKFRKIRVDVDNHDYKVLTRKGYYAPRPSRG
jgi:VWFA-related protein